MSMDAENEPVTASSGKSTAITKPRCVFSQYGFRGSTADQIADAAGMSSNLLVFQIKEDIHAPAGTHPRHGRALRA